MSSSVSARRLPRWTSACFALFATLAAGHAFAQAIDTFAGGGTLTADGTHRTALKLVAPSAVVVRGSDVYVADAGRIRRIGADGLATTVAGTGVSGFAGDGGPATSAQVSRVSALAFAPDGSLWFADAGNLRVRRIDADGIVSTVAGNGTGPDAGASGAATGLALGDIRGLALDSQGRAYIASPRLVRRMDADGTATVVAGLLSCSNTLREGDPAWNACFRGITAIAVDSDEMFIVETGDERVWRVDHKQALRYTARNLAADGVTQADVRLMSSVAIDPWNRAYVSHRDHPRVDRFESPVGPIAFAGNGTAGFSGDGGAATAAQLDDPGQIALGQGRLYVVDAGNDRVRVVPLPSLPVPARPPPPRVLAGSQEAYLWLAPAPQPGASPVTGYTVEAVEIDTGVVTVLDPDAGTLQMNRVITGLNPGDFYRFRVVAHNAHGAGAPSGYSEQVQPINLIRAVIPERLEVVEGDEGLKDVVVRIDIPERLPRDIVWDVSLRDTAGVEPGIDYEAASPLRMTIPAGELGGSFKVRVRGDTDVEYDEMLRMHHSIVSGPRVYINTHSDLMILNDDEPPPPPDVPGTVDDQFRLAENAAATTLAVLANDAIDASKLVSGLAVTTEPLLGSVAVDDAGTPGRGDDILRYTPAADRTGTDVFSYSLCYAEGCAEAMVTVHLKPVADVSLTLGARSGARDVPLVSTRDRHATSYRATPLVSPRIAYGEYNSFTIDVPAGDPRRDWRLLVDARGTAADADFELKVSVDADGDFWDDPEEVRCHSAMGTQHQRCELPVQVGPDGGTIAYWVRVVQRNSVPVVMDVFEVPMVDADGDTGEGVLAATAPSRLAKGDAFALRLGWDVPSAYDGAVRAGYLRVRENGQPAGEVPVRLEFTQPALTARPLLPGEKRLFEIAEGTTDARVFVDVPEGATSLSVTADNAYAHDVYLVKGAASNPATSVIVASPSIAGAAQSALGITHTKTLTLDAPQLTPGRWYVVTRAREYGEPGGRTRLFLEATIEGAAPVVRPGSYFNAARPGHGLLLYPAADQWAGLWYTYLEDGTPTWYYLQAPAPAIDGVWTSKLFRSTWQGTGNHLVAVGHAVLTPSGPDAFQLSYMVDGVAGSEPLGALGRGCPMLSGQPVDASSHWFDPARAGSGYSVQLWPDYEFHAAFLYDGQGMARFLTAESGDFAGADATLVLEQLQGFCPTCAAVAPTRQPVGTIRRLFGEGGLTRVQVDAMFDAPLAGDWIVDDRVVLLGGPGSTQGCAP